ncbi:nucleolar protein 7 isoform X1 [Hippoglossus hippoglossus]|uniref:nucleolar protein 7 isoform X1 n=1 Tax=Hippoglossus hippoglossus TaxID=8267 RepID=UPI00148DAC7C|nr:nucleolar protein 7 isoform X1 [Hippoglossus hippoglossus]
MAEKQRGKTAASSKTADKREDHEGNMSLFLESSDDEAPEELTFEESKLEALRCVKDALDSARRDKEMLKEKRRRRQELFQEQKKRRLLPADVLEEIDSSTSKNQKPSEHEGEEQQEEKQQKKQKKKSGKLAHIRNLKGNYKVATVKEPASATFQQQAAEAFIQSRLYGPGSCRTTNNELLSLQNKKGRNKSAAVQFVKKDWASKERAKAEKLKKRWLHKQQIPSC